MSEARTDGVSRAAGGMSSISRARRTRNTIMTVVMVASLTVALIPLGWILVTVAHKGLAAMAHPGFFTQGPPGDASKPGGGVANGIIGTLIMVGLAIAMAVPLGIAGAIYMTEFGRDSRLARAIRFFAEVMTGIPSIVYGIFAYTLIVISAKSFSAFAGAVAVGLIMWPLIVRTSEEILLRVPTEIREAALALGAPKWRVILRVILPTGASGLVTGVMLAVARAAGETAPLLFTALGNQFISYSLNKPISALPLEIFRGATSPYEPAIERAWAAAATLILLVLLLNLIARLVAARRPVEA
jgi:phosphate transport system permease protein